MEKIIDAEKFVEENFKGLADFIEDKDILQWYKSLIVSAITEYEYEPKEVEQNEWQLCPKCNGQGIVSIPPFVAGDNMFWSGSTAETYQCGLCNGAKVILKPTKQKQ